MNKQELGKIGEAIAVRELKKLGYIILKTNYRSNYGEIDIIAKERDYYVFVEVKTRYNQTHDEALESITKYKQRNIIRTATAYIQEEKLNDVDYRIDAVTIVKDGGRDWDFRLLKDAVEDF